MIEKQKTNEELEIQILRWYQQSLNVPPDLESLLIGEDDYSPIFFSFLIDTFAIEYGIEKTREKETFLNNWFLLFPFIRKDCGDVLEYHFYQYGDEHYYSPIRRVW